MRPSEDEPEIAVAAETTEEDVVVSNEAITTVEEDVVVANPTYVPSEDDVVVTGDCSLQAPMSVPAGSTIAVTWQGPNNEGDFVGVGKASKRYKNYVYTSEGSPGKLLLPTTPGDYELCYYSGKGEIVRCRRKIQLTKIKNLSIEATSAAELNGQIEVQWTGPDYEGDFVAVGLKNKPNSYLKYFYTSEGSPHLLQMPTTEGSYELRYFAGQDDTVLFRRDIAVTAVESLSLSFPSSAKLGDTIPVEWQGPDADGDFVGVGLKSKSNQYLKYFNTCDGSPGMLTMPTKPGDYEVRYFSGQDNKVLHRQPIRVSELDAISLEVPASAVIGETLSIGWTGPDYSGDFVSIRVPKKSFINYFYTTDGNPGSLKMPTKPGAYEMCYHLGQDDSVAHAVPIKVDDLSDCYLKAPEEATAGSSIQVEWKGPACDGDYVGIGKKGNKAEHLEYFYTEEESPSNLRIPNNAKGEYEIKYFFGQDNSILISIPIRIV